MKKPVVIAVVGSKSSGKTTAIEVLTRELTKRDYKVAAVKHIPEANFTIDKTGKDTWRFAQSGAQKIISVAPNEIATIEKANTENFSIKEILQKCEGYDIVFLEGFRKLVSKDKSIYKIVVVKSAEEAIEATKSFEPILIFTGIRPIKDVNTKIPYVDLLENTEKIVDLIEKVGLWRFGDFV
jgi:molybdopterin-guanine dinucleotide biosynthesis protein MobB